MSVKYAKAALIASILLGGLASCSHTSKSAYPSHSSMLDCFENRRYRLFPGDQVELICMQNLGVVDSYHIQIDDRIIVRFPSLPGYSLEQPVKPDGCINLPRLARVKVAGMTLEEADSFIRNQYEGLDWHPEFFIALTDYSNTSDQVRRIFTGAGDSFGRRTQVGPDGFISLPVVGQVAVGGKTLEEAAESVREKYWEYYPQLYFDLNLARNQGDRVFIYGFVRSPGGYSIGATQSIYEALALAGGPINSSNMRSVYLIKVKDTTIQCSRVNIKKMRRDNKSVILCPNTIIFVPQRPIHTAADFMRQLQAVIFFRGFGMGWSWDLNEALN
ncbi:MAG: hypothetical protein GF398_01810 [Chitinivibrionales bacterium]|nr:hypothetical protein [Chitinivibrionales bacterium]